MGLAESPREVCPARAEVAHEYIGWINLTRLFPNIHRGAPVLVFATATASTGR